MVVAAALTKNSSLATNPIEMLKSNKEGTIMLEPGIWKTYLCIMVASFAFFFLVLFLWKQFFDKIWKDEKYLELADTHKWYYLSNWAQNVHHILICSYIFWIGFNSTCDNSYPFIFFFDDVCLMTIQKEYVFAIMITLGYLVFDFIT